MYLLKVKKLPLQLCWYSGPVSTGLPDNFCPVNYVFSNLVHKELLYGIKFLMKCHYCLTLVCLPVFCEVQELLCIPFLCVFPWLQVSWSHSSIGKYSPTTLTRSLCRSLEFSFSTAPSSAVHCPANGGCLALPSFQSVSSTQQDHWTLGFTFPLYHLEIPASRQDGAIRAHLVCFSCFPSFGHYSPAFLSSNSENHCFI